MISILLYNNISIYMEEEEEDPKKISFENDAKGRDDELSSYQDEYIDLSIKGMKINKYYFPLMTCKIIPIHKIKNINLIELNRINGKYTFFGLSWKFIYYHLDRKRPRKTHAITFDEENNLITIGITPDNPHKCFNVLRYLITHMKNNKQFEPLYKDSETEFLKNGKQKTD